MIRRLFLATLLVGLAFCGFSGFQHTGGTDSYGGHTDSSTGEYHYHHGNPAHFHDNGICEYGFTSTYSNSYFGTKYEFLTPTPNPTSTPTPTLTPTPATTTNQDSNNAKSNNKPFWVIALILLATVGAYKVFCIRHNEPNSNDAEESNPVVNDPPNVTIFNETSAKPNLARTTQTDGMVARIAQKYRIRVERTVYWTMHGSVFHLYLTCPKIANSKRVISGQLKQAVEDNCAVMCEECRVRKSLKKHQHK